MKKSRPLQGESLQHLLRGAVEMIRSRTVAVSLAVLSFALLMAAVSTFAASRIDLLQRDILVATGYSEDEFIEKMSAWVTETSDLDLVKFLALSRSSGVSFGSATTRDNAPMMYVLQTTPWIMVSLFLDVFILSLSFTYFLTLFADPLITPFDAALKLPGMLFRMIGLALWMMIRSFSWIPVAGPILAVYFIPRFTLAPALVASGDSTIAHSVKISMQRTQKKWLKIFGFLVFLFLLSILFLWLALVLASAISLFFMKVGFLVWLCSIVLVIAFEASYLVILTAILV